MIKPHEQLDKRFLELQPWLPLTARPPHGWIRAIRQALGMKTGQMAKRMDVTQPRINELEKSEEHGSITLKSLERAAEALGCRVVYVVVPNRPLAETLKQRATVIAERQLSAVEQTMRLEDQEVGSARRRQALDDLANKLLQKPSRLWDGS